MNQQPYIGLRPFERHETELFFGREQHTDELIDRLAAQHFLAVVGNSGCGKSSLVKTGLIAGLEAGFLPTAASSHWRIIELRPGNRPFAELAKQLLKELAAELSPHYDQNSLEQRLHQGSLSLHELLAEHPLPYNAQLLIVCDQFEELFRYAGQGAAYEASNFVSLLLASSQAYPISPERLSHSLYVVITLRSDFLGDCTQFAGLAEAINQGLYLTPRLNTRQLRAAIEEPALVCGGAIDPALVCQLLEDAGHNPDQLPLLQHILMRLWAVAADKTQIGLNEYEALGGLAGALSGHADEALASLSKRQRKLAQQLFCLLTGQDKELRDTRRPVKLGKLVQLSQQPYREVVAVLDVFRGSDYGFLVPPASLSLAEETVIDISHECLIRQWQQLKDWVKEEAEQTETYRWYLNNAVQWQKNGGQPFLQSPQLEVAVAWLETFKPTVLWAERYTLQADTLRTTDAELGLVVAYILESQADKAAQLERERQAQQRQIKQARLVAAVCFIGVLGAGGLAYWAMQERHHAEAEARKAEQAEQKRTVELFQARLTHASLLAKSEDYAGAKQVLQATYPLDKDIAVEKRHARNLLASFSAMQGGEAEQVYQGAGYPLLAVAVSPDGQLLAAAGEHGTLVVFDVKTGAILQRLVGHSTEGTEQENSVFSIVFTPDSQQLLSAGDDEKIIVWQRGADQRFSQQTVWQAAAKVRALAISPDGRTVASGGDDNAITLRDLATGQVQATLTGHSERIAENALSFSADGTQLASGSYDDTAIIWQVATGKAVQVLTGHTGYVNAVAFSGDGASLLTASEDNTLRLWAVATGKQQQSFVGHTNQVFAAAFLGNGDYVLSGSFDRSLILWDRRSGSRLRRFQGHTAGVGGIATYADQLFSASNDGTVRRWPLALPYQQTIDLPSEAAATALAPDADRVAVGFADGRLAMYDGASGQALWQQADAHKDVVKRLAFNSTGALLASGSFDETAKIWRLDAQKPPQLTVSTQATLTGHSRAIHAVAFASDSQTVATASDDGRIGLFPLADASKPVFINAHERGVASVGFNGAGTQLLSSGEDNLTKLWAIKTAPPTLIKAFPKANDQLLWSSLSPNQQFISAVGRDLVVTVNNTQTDEHTELVGHENAVFKSLFTPDSATLASVSTDATVRLWDIGQASELFSLRLATKPSPPIPLWDFDFLCQKTCRLAVPLTAGKLLLYRFSYEDRLDFAHDPAEQKRTALVLWQNYLQRTATLLKGNALPAAEQAYREAEVIGQPLRAQYPNDALVQVTAQRSFILQAQLQQRLGRLPEALAAYQQALSLAEQRFGSASDQAAAFAELLAIAKDYLKALGPQPNAAANSLIQEVLALSVSDVSVLITRAKWTASLGRQAAVDKDLLQAAAIVDKKDARRLNSVGWNLISLSTRYQEAYPLLKQAVLLKPDNANIMDSFGWVLHKLGKPSAAVAYLQAAYCRKDQLSFATKEELSQHRQAVFAALNIDNTPEPLCQQVQVATVNPGSPAAALGLRVGDVLSLYNGKPIPTVRAFDQARQKHNNRAQTLTVLRDGQALNFTLPDGDIGVKWQDADVPPPKPPAD